MEMDWRVLRPNPIEIAILSRKGLFFRFFDFDSNPDFDV